MDTARETPPARRIAGWLLLLPLLIVMLACWRYQLFEPLHVDYFGLLAGVMAWHLGLAALATWGPWRTPGRIALWPALAALPGLVGLVVFAGPMAVAVALLLALVAIGLGSFADRRETASFPASLIVGLGFIAAGVGWLLPLPVHQRGVYLLLATALIVLRRRPIAGRLRDAAASVHGLASTQPRWLILLAAATTLASLGLWLPSLNYDDNAVHLILPSQLLFDGYYHLDVQTQSWAVAPWANNVLHAVAGMFAGGEVRPAVAMLWLLVGVVGAWRLARVLDASPGAALAAAAIFASQPLAGYFTTTMQVDGASAAILLNLAAMAVGPHRSRLGAVAIGGICGLLLALKTSNLIYMAPLLAWLIATRGAGTRLRWTAMALATLLLVGGSSYAYAVLVTGNPLFPFYNAVFQSPYYPIENFADVRWHAGVSWRSLWDLTFKTGTFGEFYPGAAGITLLALLPALLADAVRRSASRWLLVWAFGTGLLVFSYLQYLRYIFPAMSVLAVLGVVALARLAERRAFVVAVLLLVTVNAALMPTTSWFALQNHWTRLLREGPGARGEIVREVMPERALLERVMAADPDACVLMADPKKPFVGAGHGHAISMHRRYDPALWRARNAANEDASGKRWSGLLAQIQPSLVIVDASRETLLVRTLQADGYRLLERESSLEAWSSPSSSLRRCGSRLVLGRDQARRITLAGGMHRST